MRPRRSIAGNAREEAAALDGLDEEIEGRFAADAPDGLERREGDVVVVAVGEARQIGSALATRRRPRIWAPSQATAGSERAREP